VGSFYERYKNGEYEQVWAELVSYGEAIRDDARMLEDAVSVAHETMSRARYNIELLVERLRNLNYKFLYDAKRENPHPHIAPNENITDWLDWFESSAGFIPISVRTFIEEVGDVNFGGAHPRLCEYAQSGIEYDLKVLTDPLSIGIIIYYDLEDYKYHNFMAKDENKKPYTLWLSPDECHKSNYSGGGPFEILVPDGAADAIFHGTKKLFVEYLRHSFKWGGFPGLSIIADILENRESLIEQLEKKLKRSRISKYTIEQQIEQYRTFTEADLPRQEIAYLTEGLLPI
jgi:hypothetical protein